MLIRGLLERVKARAFVRDLIGTSGVVISLLGLFFLVYGIIDYLFQLSRPVRLGIAFIAAVSAFAAIARTIHTARRRDILWAASEVEKETGAFNNELVAFAESYDHPSSIAPYIRERLEAALSVRLSALRSNQVVSIRPSRPALILFMQVAVTYVLLAALLPGPVKETFARLILVSPASRAGYTVLRPVHANASQAGADLFEELRIILTPPDYTRRAASEQIDNGEIVALAGTRAEVIIKTGRPASTVRFSLGSSEEAQMSSDDGLLHRASFVIKEDSSYRVSVLEEGEPHSRWEAIYGIRAIKDRAPEVYMNRPASDLLFSPGQVPDSIPIRIRAKDDFGIGSMKLRYIKATGEGDGSRFESGEIKVQATPTGEGSWSGALSLDLRRAGLEPGVSVVIQAEAADNNNLTGPSTGYSENIILQVSEPEKVRIEVDNLGPDEVLKFLTSQRMILIKTESLHKQREKIGDKELRARSQELAVEQRRFRESFNEFTDMREGHDHQGDEEETEEQPEGHNAALPEIPAGASDRVRALITAIRAMWRAETELQLANTETAIVYEKEALTHLKIAQSGARHVTRFAPRSKPVDLKRRYQGRLDEIRNRIERTGPDSQEQPLIQLTPILKGLYQAARSLAGTGDVKSAAQRIDKTAEDLLRVEGVAISSLVEPAAKLKLITRLMGDMAKNEGQQERGLSDARQTVIKLVADVCGQIASLMADDAGLGRAPSPLNLSPSAGSKGAAYFKLLTTRSQKSEARSQK